MLEKMGSSAFDYRNDVVVSEDLSEPLVPVRELSLSFERGRARVQAISDGTSLALLPLQYSHCLHLSDPKSRLVRADLAMAGLVFNGHLDTVITDDFGLFTPSCRALDNADISQLKMAIANVSFSSNAIVRPTAITRISDLVPTVTGVIKKIWQH
jgi:hypothetical protein